jgi:hypothetical protein
MKNEIKVSVIVPVYKVEKYLRECIESLINQSLKEIEILLIDEGDDDECGKIIEEYAKIDKRIVAPRKKMGGYGKACNYGIRRSRGKYISIVESDDFVDRDMLKEMYLIANKYQANIVKTPYIFFNSTFEKECEFFNKLQNKYELEEGSTINIDGKEFLPYHPSIWSCLYLKEFLISNGIFFPEGRGSSYVDHEFKYLAYTKTKNILYLSRLFYHYRIDNDQASSARLNMKLMTLRWKDLHELIGKECWNKNTGIYLIKEEYTVGIGQFNRYEATEDEIKMLKSNLSYSSYFLVARSPFLSLKQKIKITLFKLFPTYYYKLISHRRRVNNNL